MHSIVMPSYSFLNDFLVNMRSDSMLPILSFETAVISAEPDAIPSFRNSVYLGSLQSDDTITICGTDPQKNVNVTDVVDALTNCRTDVKRMERVFLQPPLFSGGLVHHADGLPP